MKSILYGRINQQKFLFKERVSSFEVKLGIIKIEETLW